MVAALCSLSSVYLRKEEIPREGSAAADKLAQNKAQRNAAVKVLLLLCAVLGGMEQARQSVW